MKRGVMMEITNMYYNKSDHCLQTPEFKSSPCSSNQQWETHRYDESSQCSQSVDSRVLISKLQQQNSINQRLIVQLRRMYEQERKKVRHYEVLNASMYEQLSQKHDEVGYLKYALATGELNRQRESQELHDKIVQLQDRLQSIPLVLDKLLIASCDFQESVEDVEEISQSRSSCQKKTFRLKSFKNSMCNLMDGQSQDSL